MGLGFRGLGYLRLLYGFYKASGPSIRLLVQ